MRRFLKSKLGIITIILLSIIILFFLSLTNILKPIKNLLIVPLKPLQSVFFDLSNNINNKLKYFSSIKKLEKENEELKNKISTLSIENNKMKNQLEESEILKKELSFLEKNNLNYVLAKVIGKSNLPGSQIHIINKGEDDGIKRDMSVIINEGVLIGKIIEAEKNISKLILLTDSHNLVAAMIQNEQQTKGMIKGYHGLSIEMELIPQDQKIEKGQLVVTSGIELNVPKGLVIGEIDKIIKKKGELFQSASIKPYSDFNNLSVVSIISQ